MTEIWQGEYWPFVTLENFLGLSLCVYVCAFTVDKAWLCFCTFQYLSLRRDEKNICSYPAWSKVIRLKYGEAA